MPQRFLDAITGEVITSDADPDFMVASGYEVLSGGSVSNSEWLSAQDPADLERKRLDRLHGKKVWDFYGDKSSS